MSLHCEIGLTKSSANGMNSGGNSPKQVPQYRGFGMRQSCSTIEPTELQQHMLSEQESIGPSAEYMSFRLICWELANRYSFGERGALPPAQLQRYWFETVGLMPVGSGDLFDFSYSERRQGLQRQSDESRSICLADNCDAVS